MTDSDFVSESNIRKKKERWVEWTKSLICRKLKLFAQARARFCFDFASVSNFKFISAASSALTFRYTEESFLLSYFFFDKLICQMNCFVVGRKERISLELFVSGRENGKKNLLSDFIKPSNRNYIELIELSGNWRKTRSRLKFIIDSHDRQTKTEANLIQIFYYFCRHA